MFSELFASLCFLPALDSGRADYYLAGNETKQKEYEIKKRSIAWVSGFFRLVKLELIKNKVWLVCT